MGSPTQRTLKEMRKRGYELVQVVEHWNPFAKRRMDLFGIADIVCVGGPNDEIVAVQTTSDDNVSKRITKINDSQAIDILRKVGIRVLVHGWRKVKGRYVLREVDLS
jgi:hypothetical protein